MALRRAIGAVKDQTSISLAKVNNVSDSLTDLEIAVVKATRHEEFPAEERHVREILNLTHYSRHHVSACVSTIARRLSKTRNWVVALKSLMLIQRLLEEEAAAYEQEVFFATRRGTRLLNLSDFRDTTGRLNAWDYSAFVRTFALYMDERLEYRMQGRKKSHNVGCGFDSRRYFGRRDGDEEAVPTKAMNLEQLITKISQLQQLLDRFLATRPAGASKHHRVVMVALYQVVKDSFQTYYEITDILSLLVERFTEVDISEAIKIYDIFRRSSKQFSELESYYTWSKQAGITRSSEYPEIERLSQEQIQQMDDFIREKSANSQVTTLHLDPTPLRVEEEPQANVEEDLNDIKALPAPPEEPKEEEIEAEVKHQEMAPTQHEGDLLNLWDDPMTSEQHGDQLSLVLFDGLGSGLDPGPSSGSAWDAFKESNADWETELVQSTSYLPQQRTQLGGGLDMLVLDGLYRQGSAAFPSVAPGSASSVAFGSVGNPPAPMLALPAPPVGGGEPGSVQIDPFGQSMAVPPPSYVQMSDLEKKQRLMMEEQIMWNQYRRNGMMQGQMRVPQGQNPYQNGYGYY